MHENGGTSHLQYHLLKVEIKSNNVMIDGKNTFYKPVNNDIKTYESIRKIVKEMITQLVLC